MSFFILRDEFSISQERTAKWNIFGGVSNQFTFLESIYGAVSNTFTFSWNILFYVSREFTFLWDIWRYVSREFIYLYRMAMDYSAKVKYSFSKSGVVTRFFRRNRLG
jgi:hypothetical protein